MSSSDMALSERFCTAMESAASRSPRLAWRGRTFTAGWVVRIGDIDHFLKTEAGSITTCRRTLPLMPDVRLCFTASAAAWEAFWQPVPVAGWHDLFALSKRGELRMEGDMHLLLAHLQYHKDVLALPRGMATT